MRPDNVDELGRLARVPPRARPHAHVAAARAHAEKVFVGGKFEARDGAVLVFVSQHLQEARVVPREAVRAPRVGPKDEEAGRRGGARVLDAALRPAVADRGLDAVERAPVHKQVVVWALQVRVVLLRLQHRHLQVRLARAPRQRPAAARRRRGVLARVRGGFDGQAHRAARFHVRGGRRCARPVLAQPHGHLVQRVRRQDRGLEVVPAPAERGVEVLVNHARFGLGVGQGFALAPLFLLALPALHLDPHGFLQRRRRRLRLLALLFGELLLAGYERRLGVILLLPWPAGCIRGRCLCARLAARRVAGRVRPVLVVRRRQRGRLGI